MREWIGKTIREVSFRNKYHVSILGIKSGEHVSLLPMADHEFKVNEHLMVIGKKVDIDKILKNL